MIARTLVMAVLACGSLACSALAHKPSDSYLRIDTSSGKLHVEWDIALRDLELLVGLDADRDGKITWGEVQQRQAAIAGHALSHLQVLSDDSVCELSLTEMMVTEHSDGGYAVLLLQGDCPTDSALHVSYSLLFDVDPTHRGLILYKPAAEVENTYILSVDAPGAKLGNQAANPWETLVHYIREGIWHIWIGLDHILFLLALLLPAVVFRKDSAWQPLDKFRPACWGVLKIVTMFTLAHSITLWLAVMDYATPPSRVVESIIALSIVITAINNIFPVLPLSNWVIAFIFGLVHGFGFANVLLDLGLSSTSLALALFGFNVGVELGQMAIVLIFMPVAFALRRTKFYDWIILRGGSIAVAIIALLWFYERAFNAELIPI